MLSHLVCYLFGFLDLRMIERLEYFTMKGESRDPRSGKRKKDKRVEPENVIETELTLNGRM